MPAYKYPPLEVMQNMLLARGCELKVEYDTNDYAAAKFTLTWEHKGRPHKTTYFYKKLKYGVMHAYKLVFGEKGQLKN